MTLDSSWWLVIILGITALLFGIALMRRDPAVSITTKKAIPPTSAELIKLNKLINRHLPRFSTTLRHNRIIMRGDNEKRLMLTIDGKISEGSRQLGDATVVNFHKLPSVTTLKKTLQSQLTVDS